MHLIGQCARHCRICRSVGSVGLHEPAAHLYGLYVGLGVYRTQVVPQASLDPVYHLIHMHPHGELPGLAGPGVPIGQGYWASVGIVCIGWPDCVWIVSLCTCAGLGWPRSGCGLGGLGGLAGPGGLGLSGLAGSPAGSGLWWAVIRRIRLCLSCSWHSCYMWSLEACLGFSLGWTCLDWAVCGQPRLDWGRHISRTHLPLLTI